MWLMSPRGNLHIHAALDSDEDGEERLPRSLGGVKPVSPQVALTEEEESHSHPSERLSRPPS